MANIKITLVKSTISCSKVQKGTIAALGLHKIGQSKEFKDSDTLKGQIAVVSHLIKVENV